jgi:rhombotail lipoprotein
VFTASGTVSEDQLQHVLESPIDLQFPARIGVVPLAQAFDAQAKATITVRGTASRDLAQSLIGQPYFSHVSDISTDLPNGGGLEGLRAIAARYRLRYLLLYSERFEDTTHANAWAWLYPTVLGVFLAPGVTVSSRGLAQADLLDVRTGTVLFSVVEPMETSSQQLAVGSARAHAELQQKVAAAAAKKLARRVHEQTDALIAFADESTKKGDTAVARILPAPVIRSRPASAP